MFRRFTTPSGGLTQNQKAEILFRLHPIELAALLELAWELRVWYNSFDLGHPLRRSDLPEIPEYLLDRFPFSDNNRSLFTQQIADGIRFGTILWDHLIYAYLIENTRIYDIFRRVIHEYRHGERLGVPLASSQHWLRNTEELFFRDPAPFTIYSVTSYVRPDQGATRRNAYYRMFGMDLNHGMDDNKAYPYEKPDVANREFVRTLEEFLREVWIAIANANNETGMNPKDDAGILNLAIQLKNMLITRRTYGNLSQEEFWFVSMMSWFHLTVEFNSPIINSLRAEGASTEERLKKVAERTKLPAHGKSFYFFRLADPMSRLLTQIEAGVYDNLSSIPALYEPEFPTGSGNSNPIEQDMRLIITYWSNATDRNMKSKVLPVSST
jgi:hypothetical protein